ncbi:unnamed protein product [Brassica rapa subsp. trilocularis]
MKVDPSSSLSSSRSTSMKFMFELLHVLEREGIRKGAVSSPHCYFKENTMMNPNSSNVEASFQPKPQEFVTVPPTAWTKPNKR